MEAPDLEGGRHGPFPVPHPCVRTTSTGSSPGTVNWRPPISALLGPLW